MDRLAAIRDMIANMTGSAAPAVLPWTIAGALLLVILIQRGRIRRLRTRLRQLDTMETHRLRAHLGL
jgi:hypothetical protein